MKPKFEPRDDGLEIIDPIERHRYQLTTHESVDPDPVDTDLIQYPVDTAVETTAEMITLPTNDTVYIRDTDRAMVAEVQASQQISLPRDEYTLDLSGPLKVYARVKSSVQIYSDSEHTYITLDKSTSVILGARSYHRRPAGTITTTEDPTDLIQVISTFGSALKSTTPERSYPTHRGHPPAIELGNQLSIPEKFKQPDTSIQIKIPPTFNHIFVITPLAYYLGAEVVAGSKAEITTENGFTYDLGKEGEFETNVEQVLKQIFLFDCILRTEGPTPLSLPERKAIEPNLEFDIESVYKQSLPEQLSKYLSEPFSKVEPHLPEWRLKTRLEPTADSVEFLPFLADELSIINVVKRGEEGPKEQVQSEAIEEFTRNDYIRSASPSRGSNYLYDFTEYDVPTIEQSWETDDSSNIISATPLSAFSNSIGRRPKEDPIAIEVVCNDRKMREELETVDGVYGNHEELPFNVTVHYDLNCNELKNILSKPSDFFHYIGHIDEQGFQCSNGKLNASSIESVGAKAFLLNACQSYEQGLHLVEAGSIGGIVTLGDILNSGAVNVGETVARLLNQGFPLYAALEVTRKESITGEQYRIVGDGITTIAQSKTRTPTLCSIIKDDPLSVELTMYVSSSTGKGGLFKPYLEPIDLYHVLPGKTGEIEVTKPQLRDFFELEEVPVLYDDTVYWSNDIPVDGIYSPP